MANNFDTSLSDSQATLVLPIQPKNFDFAGYEEYVGMLNKRCSNFWEQQSGVLVYRRMRVAECFSHGCCDMKRSLELQLGALQKKV